MTFILILVIFVPFGGLDIVGILHSASKQDAVRMTVKVLEYYLDIAAKTGGHQVVVVFDMVGFNLKDYAWRPGNLTMTFIKLIVSK